uniref:Solute carrier family 13 member 2 n=1 Tax=Salarias fasciatus TaxID=181472 RepID=A0A672G279_SALFA
MAAAQRYLHVKTLYCLLERDARDLKKIYIQNRSQGSSVSVVTVCLHLLPHAFDFLCLCVSRCGYAIALMALYWCTECMPLAVTALLPVVLFPMMGIMTVSIEYLKDTNMLFVGGLVVAIAVEHWNLHKRIALRVLLLVGVRPALLMMGFMIVSSFLSMWISNTATTAMMLPIAQAVLQQLRATELRAEERDLRDAGADNHGFELEVTERKSEDAHHRKPDMQVPDEDPPEHESERVLLCQHRRHGDPHRHHAQHHHEGPARRVRGQTARTARARSGTDSSLFLLRIFPKNGDTINFATWFGFAFPNMVLMLVLSWIWLQFMFLGFNLKKSFGCGVKSDRDKEAYAVMKEEYAKLGRIKFAEVAVLFIFILLVILWFTREPGFIDGWATVLFNRGFVSDGTVAIFMALFFFVIPVEALPPLLNWQVVHERMPWNIVLLLGGGYALAKGSEVSKLSTWLGSKLTPLQSIPPAAISILLCLLVATFTECSSNTATTTLFLPILASMATAIELHPLYVMLPCTISASLAFMLPVATPPNAIAFSYGDLKVLDMVKAGFFLNIIGILTTNLAINTWGFSMFNMGTFPQWANLTDTNSTRPE